jgi:hypothetical protein
LTRGSGFLGVVDPGDWKLVFDGETISLSPSVGSWNLSCLSHYWIRRNRILWAPRWSEARVQRARNHERALEERSPETGESDAVITASDIEEEASVWSILRKWWPR